ncbi:peptidase dimerization domain-containing protein, partial [Aeromonas caviae]
MHGISAHGSTPHKGLDAIREAVRIIEDMDY